ncbi:hypothetical protein OTU49_017337 [Cherax quadricarinatus]|uniref:Uncharacterized protein n=1 Tax=Cherax quadricarinatus TaxID=27406 RepID=A0AAW0XNW2_CHEQU
MKISQLSRTVINSAYFTITRRRRPKSDRPRPSKPTLRRPKSSRSRLRVQTLRTQGPVDQNPVDQLHVDPSQAVRRSSGLHSEQVKTRYSDTGSRSLSRVVLPVIMSIILLTFILRYKSLYDET